MTAITWHELGSVPSSACLAGKVVVGDFLRESLNVNTETIKTGKNADAASPYNGRLVL